MPTGSIKKMKEEGSNFQEAEGAKKRKKTINMQE